MAGEGQFAYGGENTQPRQSAVAGWLLHEYGFGEVHFSCNGLHLAGREAVAIGDHGQGIACKWSLRKDVELIEMALDLPAGPHSLFTKAVTFVKTLSVVAGLPVSE